MVAFEPAAVNYFILAANCELNAFGERVDCLPIGVGADKSVERLDVSQFEPAHSFSFRHKGRRPLSSRQATLVVSIDELIHEHGLPCPNYIKIDVPALTGAIIEGGARTLPAAAGARASHRSERRVHGRPPPGRAADTGGIHHRRPPRARGDDGSDIRKNCVRQVRLTKQRGRFLQGRAPIRGRGKTLAAPDDYCLVSDDAPNGSWTDSVDMAAAAFLCFGCRGAHSRPSAAKSDRAVRRLCGESDVVSGFSRTLTTSILETT